ncbi:BamA/TamA family outer membrane protein [Pseudophaeobacter leonis]|uniref:BamA/TamA family outer membrane protein n=1 Tax=Pseudophaeobacter leonis TaxID=1144477 RepID=UPI003B980D02
MTLRATFEGGALNWLGDNSSRSLDRFVLSPSVMRGFEPGGIGPRDRSARADGGTYDDFLGGNLFAVARFDAGIPPRRARRAGPAWRGVL